MERAGNERGGGVLAIVGRGGEGDREAEVRSLITLNEALVGLNEALVTLSEAKGTISSMVLAWKRHTGYLSDRTESL